MGTLLIDKLLQTVCTQRASDLHLTVGSQPVLRLHGHMRPLATKVLEPSDTAALMKSITPERCQQELQEVGGCDFGFAFGEMARFRVAIFKQRGNIGLVLRRIPNEFLTFQQIGLPAVMEELIQRPRGLILVTGPTGSGKTTSLASMINWLNNNLDRHIITIEDPIEYYHKHKKSLVNQREIGIDVPDFPEAIRRALRMDPDIILVGEMRDLATIQAAITAAETGHIVFGTLHTNSAEGTVNRIIDARLVVLPEPVGPVTRIRPRGRVINCSMTAGRPSCSKVRNSFGIRRRTRPMLPRCLNTATRNRAISPKAKPKSVPPTSWSSCWQRSGVMLFIRADVSDGSSTFVWSARM
jgi:pilus retraction protein PilT